MVAEAVRRGFSIRRARLTDSQGIASLAGQLGYPISEADARLSLERLRADAGHAVFVAETSGKGLVGWTHVFERPLLIKPAGAELGGLVVDQDARRSGAGSALLAEAERWAANRGLVSLLIRSNTTRAGARAFYLSLGYELIKVSNTFEKVVGQAGQDSAG